MSAPLTGVGKFLASGSGQAVLGGLASSIGSIFGGSSRRKAYHRSKRLMEYQMGLDKQMFDYQNAYNTPGAQMSRLKSAGLNPALMYGQGTTGNASGYPQSKFTQLDAYNSQGDIAQSTAAGIQQSLLNAQLKQIKENTMYTKIKGANETKNTQYQTALADQQTSKLREETITEVSNRALIIAQKGKAVADTINTEIVAEINKIDRDWLKENKTSKYDHQLIRAIKSVLGTSLKEAMEYFLENRYMFETPNRSTTIYDKKRGRVIQY